MARKSVISLAALVLFAAFVAACSPTAPVGPTVEEQPTAQPTESVPEPVSIFITFDEGVASGVTREETPATGAGEDLPWWGVHPEYIQFTLTGYALEETSHPAQVYVYPVEAYQALSPEAAGRIAQLQQLLAQQPATVEGELPLLPLFNAAQQIHAKMEYVTFEGGSGVRFLTQYAQAPLPVNNQDLFYTFQGLTDDGQTYIAAILPVSHPDLPPDASGANVTGEGAAYYSEVAQQLNEADPGAFTPNLHSLDEAIQSISLSALEN